MELGQPTTGSNRPEPKRRIAGEDPRTQTQLQEGASSSFGVQCFWWVSVILAGYGDDLEDLEHNLKAALVQTQGNVQIVIVADAGMVGRARGLVLEGRVLVVEASADGDRSLDRELGLRAAGGELVAFLEPGDLWFDDHLERACECFEDNAGLGLVFGSVGLVRSDPSQLVREPSLQALRAAGALVPRGHVLHNLMPLWTISGLVIRRVALLEQIGEGGMLVNRAPSAARDAHKWADFASRWSIEGVERAPAPWAFEWALTDCVLLLLDEYQGPLQGAGLLRWRFTVEQVRVRVGAEVEPLGVVSNQVSWRLLTLATSLVCSLLAEAAEAATREAVPRLGPQAPRPAPGVEEQLVRLVSEPVALAPALVATPQLEVFPRLVLEALARALGTSLRVAHQARRFVMACVRRLANAGRGKR